MRSRYPPMKWSTVLLSDSTFVRKCKYKTKKNIFRESKSKKWNINSHKTFCWLWIKRSSSYVIWTCINLFEGEGFAQVIEEHDQRLRTRFPTDGCSQLLHLIQAPHWWSCRGACHALRKPFISRKQEAFSIHKSLCCCRLEQGGDPIAKKGDPLFAGDWLKRC